MFRSSAKPLKRRRILFGRARKRRAGEGLISVALSLAIMASTAVMSMTWMRESVNDMRMAAAAEQARRVGSAVSAFVVANQATLLAETGGVGGVTFRTFAQMQAAPVAPIPASLQNGNVYRQGYALLVAQTAPGVLLPILRTYGTTDTKIPNGLAVGVAQRIGASGGFIETAMGTNGALMIGSGGGWSVARATFAALDPAIAAAVGAGAWPGVANPDTGVLALNLALSEGGLASTSNWLARVDLGNPELNTMRTTLRVAGGSDIAMASTGTAGVSRLIMGQNATAGSEIQMNDNDILGARNITTQDVTLIDKARSLAQAVQRTFSVAPGTVILKSQANCARGTLADMTPRIDVAVQSLADSSGRLNSAFEAYAVDNGASWTINLDVNVPSGGGTVWVPAEAGFSRVHVTLRCE